MIPGLHAYAREHQLVVPADLENATVGISAELLVGLSSAEIMARLGSRTPASASAAPHDTPSIPTGPANSTPSAAVSANSAATGPGSPPVAAASTGGAESKEPKSAAAPSMKFIVVFDGPARTTPSRLDDGLERRRIMRALRDARIPTIVAPALAAAQLAYLYEQRFVSHVAAADEALLWDDVPLVLNVFADHPQMLLRRALLAQLRLGETAFVEVVLGVGQNAVVDTPLPLIEKYGNPIESAVRNAIQFGGPPPPMPPPPPPPLDGSSPPPPPPPPPSISVYRAAQQVCDPAYVATLQRALAYVARQPVLGVDGTVFLRNKTGQPVPKDITEVIGCQLSPEAYWFLNRGLVGPELLRGMLWNSFTDCYRAPNSPSDAREAFERLQQQISPIRQQAYALLVAPMHRYFQVKEVVNRTPGGRNFVRTQPTEPKLQATGDSGVVEDPPVIVASAIQHARQLAGFDSDVPTLEMPETLARRALGAHSTTPAALLVQVATLVLRQIVESVVFWFLATGKVPHTVDTAKIANLLPWA